MATRAVLVVGGVAGLFLVVLPQVSGAPWGQVGHSLHQVPAAWLVGLAAIWLGGLLLHTITLTAAMPGLTHQQALQLSLTGSAIANVLPVGGAAGVALNVRMARGWGNEPEAIAAYTVVTNLWDVLAKLALPLVAVPVLLLSTDPAEGRLVLPVALGAAVAAAAVLGVIALLRSAEATARLGRCVDAVVGAGCRIARLAPRAGVGDWLARVRLRCVGVVQQAWRALTVGMLAYTASLGVLLWACCYITHTGLPVGAVLLGLAAERLLTLAGLTPGGAGLVEVGLAAVLVGLGGAPVAVVTAVLLYRIFTYGIEIPVGGLWLGRWLMAQRALRRHAPA